MARLRHHLASLACVAGIATTARAQDELWHAIGSLGFGSESTLAGDFNGDGCRDVLVGQPDWYYSWLPGQVFGLDGRTGAELFRIQDPSTAFGEHVATLGDDVNGDGVDDFLASSVSSSSTLLFSGADQTVLRNVYGIGQLQSLPDLDGDGIRDFVSASAYPGGVTVYSSASGAVLRSFLRSTIPSIAVLDDVDLDADGATDFAVGAFPFATAQPDPYVAIYSGRTYSLLRTLTTDAHGHTVGLFSGAGDVDGDGVFDFFIGSNGEDAQHDGFPAFAKPQLLECRA